MEYIPGCINFPFLSHIIVRRDLDHWDVLKNRSHWSLSLMIHKSVLINKKWHIFLDFLVRHIVSVELKNKPV